jgi:hypothetical protein
MTTFPKRKRENPQVTHRANLRRYFRRRTRLSSRYQGLQLE